MQMRPVTLFLLMACSSCEASESVVASFFYSASPADFDAHEKALIAFKEGRLTADKIPKPAADLPIAGCGSGTTLVRTKKKPGKLFLSDSSSESVIVFFTPALLAPTGAKRISLGDSDGTFLYLAVKGGGRVCAGYADSGWVDVVWSGSGHAEVSINANVDKLPLVGWRSCGPRGLTLSFKADFVRAAGRNARPSGCDSGAAEQ